MRTFFQFFRYALVGGAATAADYGSYYLLTRSASLDSLVANPLSYLAGNVVSFVGHRTITFHSHGQVAPQYLRFIGVTIVGIIISQLVVWVSLRLGVYDLIGKAFAVALSGLFNYLVNRSWTFRV